MLVFLDKETIERGKRWDVKACPIALKLAEITGFYVLVGSDTVAFWDGASRMGEATLPPNATCWIRDFDLKMTREEISFEINLPFPINIS